MLTDPPSDEEWEPLPGAVGTAHITAEGKWQSGGKKGERVGIAMELKGRWQEPSEGEDDDLIDLGQHGSYTEVRLEQNQKHPRDRAENDRPTHPMTTRSRAHANPQHQAKELGGMVKRALTQSDWQHTQIPQVQYSASAKTYRIIHSTTNTAILEHELITRHRGREKTDHYQTEDMLNTLPGHLWADGPTDVGLTDCAPITFSVNTSTPLWVRQYPHKPQAEAGIQDTIEGLLKKGVLEPSQSAWNTPILPVEKKGTGKYRMAHDLRAINDILATPICSSG